MDYYLFIFDIHPFYYFFNSWYQKFLSGFPFHNIHIITADLINIGKGANKFPIFRYHPAVNKVMDEIFTGKRLEKKDFMMLCVKPLQ